MANIYKQITLTEKGYGAGPYFDIYYSLDCVNYVLATGGSNVYLPNIGSTAVVTVDDGLQCLKLVNNSKRCFYNSEVQTFTTTTTTSTTTTTTTLAPTLNLYSYKTVAGGPESFVDFNGVTQTFPQPGYSYKFIAYSNGFILNNPGGLTLITPNVTPTFTNYRFNKGRIDYVSYVTWQNFDGTMSADLIPNVQLFVKCAVTNTPYKYDPSNNWVITDLGECNTTTTTTTIPPACTSITFDGNITHAGLTAYWTDCYGVAQSRFVPADTTYGPVCIQTGTASGQAYVVNGACTTTTSTTSTTTTTQSPAIKIDSTLSTVCSGGGISVSTITFTGGTNICNSTSISALTFNTLAAGNYYIYDPAFGFAQYNKPGGIGTSVMNQTSSGCSACPPPSTTTSTTTTTTASPSQTANWYWTNNNTIEGNGGYITIAVNGSNVVTQYDYSTPTTFSGSFSYNAGDSIATTVYTYANTTYGTDTALSIDNPTGTNIYYNYDTQPSPGSPSSVSNTFTAVAGGITITGNSNSY